MLNMVLVAIAPSLALLIFIYQKDRYDREPPGMLFKLFFYGILSVIPVYFVESFLIGYGRGSFLFQAFIVAGLTEEFFKFAVIINSAYTSKYYNEKLDGIVYCVFVSLGFATTENLLYIISRNSDYIFTGITRAVFSVPAHMLFAVTMGYYLSLAKFAQKKVTSQYYLLLALTVPMILHGFYDYILMARIYGFLIIMVVFTIYLWRISLRRLNLFVDESRKTSENK